MSLRNILKLSLLARFKLAVVLSVISFIVIFLILLTSFIQVRSDVRQVVGVHLEETISGSQLAREMGQFIARLKLLEATFYGNDDYLVPEGFQLQKMVRHYEIDHQGSELSSTITPLKEKLDEYLEQCNKVNELLALLRWEEDGLDETFIMLEELVAEQMIEAALRGEKLDYYERLTFLISSYRIALLEIVQMNTLEKPEKFFAAAFFDSPPNAEAVSSLMLKLKALSASGPPIDKFGQHLTDQLNYYQHLMARFQQEMIHLGKKNAELNQFVEDVLEMMEALDWQHEESAEQAEIQVDQTIHTTGETVLVLMTVLVLLLGLIQLNLFNQHVKKPIERVRKHLNRFKQGDYNSPMSLGRSDEWAQIETGFNDMLGHLAESWGVLQESERRYRNIFDSAAFGIFQSTLEGVLLNINPALAVMFGAEVDADVSVIQDLGEKVYANPQDRKRMIERLLQEKSLSSYDVQLRRMNGEAFWASITAHLVIDKGGKVRLIEGTIEDISHRREAEEELLQLKEYLHDIVDTMPSILIGVDQELSVSLWNQQVEDFSGVPAEKAVGQPLGEVFSLIDAAHCLDPVRRTLTEQQVVRLQKIAGINAAAGHVFDLLIYPLSTPAVAGAVIHMEDVTDKAQIEDVMVQSEKMLSVGSLAAGIAHEINNPLASVLQNVQVMDQRLSPSLKKNREVAEQLGVSIEQVAEYAQLRGFDQMIKSITDSGQRAARIIENMLNSSRKSSSSFVPCSLAVLAEKTIELAASDYDMKHHFDFRTIKVVRDYHDVPAVPCESSQIQQVILNLLKNSAQALGNKSENQEIRVRIFSQEKQVCLQVEDNGEGMDEMTRRRIFEPFYTTKTVGHGTGLGLSVSYFLITENHKGSLTVSSKQGEGTCFTVLLPLER